ncbi:MAG: hypothetical protein ACOYNI_13075 [Acidimicrobiia bacterium]
MSGVLNNDAADALGALVHGIELVRDSAAAGVDLAPSMASLALAGARSATLVAAPSDARASYDPGLWLDVVALNGLSRQLLAEFQSHGAEGIARIIDGQSSDLRSAEHRLGTFRNAQRRIAQMFESLPAGSERSRDLAK